MFMCCFQLLEQYVSSFVVLNIMHIKPYVFREMDSYSVSQISGSQRSRSVPVRRVWTVQEESQLIVGLKKIMLRGWKTENGFKTGYLGALEEHMRNHFPGTDLKSDPHIASKIHVWKKNYGSLSTMLSRSGFGWNDTSQIIDVENDQVWNEYCKVGVGFLHSVFPFIIQSIPTLLQS